MKTKFSAWSFILVISLAVFIASASILIIRQIALSAPLFDVLLLGLIFLSIISAFFVYRRIKEKERRHDETYKKLTTIFDHTPVGICIMELDSGIILDVNQGYTDIFGYSKEEILGK